MEAGSQKESLRLTGSTNTAWHMKEYDFVGQYKMNIKTIEKLRWAP